MQDEFDASVAPELCIEIVSPTNAAGEIEQKRRLYFEAGAREVWLCDLNGRLRFFTTEGKVNASAMKRRNITDDVYAALADTPVVFINGARQTGKGTLAQRIVEDGFPEQGQPRCDQTRSIVASCCTVARRSYASARRCTRSRCRCCGSGRGIQVVGCRE